MCAELQSSENGDVPPRRFVLLASAVRFLTNEVLHPEVGKRCPSSSSFSSSSSSLLSSTSSSSSLSPSGWQTVPAKAKKRTWGKEKSLQSSSNDNNLHPKADSLSESAARQHSTFLSLLGWLTCTLNSIFEQGTADVFMIVCKIQEKSLPSNMPGMERELKMKPLYRFPSIALSNEYIYIYILLFFSSKSCCCRRFITFFSCIC